MRKGPGFLHLQSEVSIVRLCVEELAFREAAGVADAQRGGTQKVDQRPGTERF